MSPVPPRLTAVAPYGRRRVPLVALALSAALFGLTACDSEGGADAKKGAGPSVIVPGGPGEDSKTLSPEEAAKYKKSDRPNSADFTYMQGMIAHHRQALLMSELAPERASSGKVRLLAERIVTGQGAEITTMEGWLKNNKAKGAGEHGGHGGHHDHAGMPGMATKAQLADLEDADGKAFDTLFLELMITHHKGGVTMAEDVLAKGNNVQVEEMATDASVQQTVEVDRMEKMLPSDDG